MQEFQEITGNPPTGCTVGLQKEDDMNVWDVHMEGPSDSLYAVSPCPRHCLEIHSAAAWAARDPPTISRAHPTL